MSKKDIRKKLMSLLRSPEYTPKTKNELAYILKLETKKEKRQLKDILYFEKIEDNIVKNQDGTYNIPPKVTGQLLANTRGFGFVRPDDDIFEDDIFIAPQNLNGAYDKDKVVIEVLRNANENHRAEGRVIDILERGNTQVVGTFDEYKKNGFVIVDNDKLNKDVYIAKDNFNGAQNGDKVVVKITKWPESHLNPEGRIVEVLGKPDERGVDIMSIIKGFDVPVDFPDEVINEAESFEDIDKDEIKDRLDLREDTIFTIDGDTAKDFDDAISIEKLDNGNYKLGVHIADVSHYVQAETDLDKEAQKRGTSIYAVDKVVPMLPEALSNNLCSLVPDEDRLTFSCIMEVNPKGQVVDYDIKRSVIHSKARMTYNSVNDFLNGVDDDTTSYLKPFKDDLNTAVELADILRNERRNERGSIDFDFDEAYIDVDNTGKPTAVNIRERGVSEKLIEEFMLLANETVAEHATKTPLTFMYRNHPHPDMEQLKTFREFLGKLGVKFGEPGTIPTNQDYQNLLKDIKGQPFENTITLLALRTMQQALYEAENKGHYALGAENYTHFTSPIRRYPDLTVHRNLGMLEDNVKLEEKDLKDLNRKIEKQAQHSSETERTAVEIEREVQKLKKAEYIAEHIGEKFTGNISGVTGFGLFVELPNTIEGLIRMSDLSDDYYYFDEDNHRLVGEKHGRIYNLGDEIDITVSNVDVDARRIDFLPAIPR